MGGNHRFTGVEPLTQLDVKDVACAFPQRAPRLPDKDTHCMRCEAEGYYENPKQEIVSSSGVFCDCEFWIHPGCLCKMHARCPKCGVLFGIHHAMINGMVQLRLTRKAHEAIYGKASADALFSPNLRERLIVGAAAANLLIVAFLVAFTRVAESPWFIPASAASGAMSFLVLLTAATCWWDSRNIEQKYGEPMH